MPRLPDAIALMGRAPRAARGIVSVDAGALSGPGRALTGLGQGAIGLGNQLQEQEDKLAYANAKTEWLKSRIDLDSTFDNDPDYSTYERRYTEGLGKVRERVLGMVRSGQDRALLEAELRQDEARGLAKIRERAFKLEADTGVAGATEQIARNRDMFIQATDPETRRQIAEATRLLIDGLVDKNYVSRAKAAELRLSTLEDFSVGSLKALPASDRIRILRGEAGPSSLPADVAATIDTVAAEEGVDAATLKRIAWLESAGDPNAVNRASGAAGLFQFIPSTAGQYGLANPNDPIAATRAAAKLMKDNRAALRDALGREPTGAELYLAHQQGAAGAAALLQSPDRPAVEVLTGVYRTPGRARSAVALNLPVGDKDRADRITAREFATLWGGKFAGDKDGVTRFIPSDRRVALLEEAEREQRREQAEARMEARVELQAFNQDAADILARGGVVDVGRYRALAARAGLDANQIERGAENIEASNRGVLKEDDWLSGGRTLRDMEREVARLQEAVPSASNPNAANLEAVAAERAYTKIRNSLLGENADPAGYIAGKNRVVNQALQDAIGESDPALSRSAWDRVMSLTQDSYAALGLAPKVKDGQAVALDMLPKSVAGGIIQDIASVSGAEMVAKLDAWRERMGDSTFSRVFPQLVRQGLPEGAKLASLIAGQPGEVAEAKRVMGIAMANPKDLEKTTAAEAKRTIDETLSDAFVEYRNSLRTENNNPAIMADLMQGAKLLAYGYISQGVDPSKAAKNAYNALVGNAYDFVVNNGETIRVPKGAGDDVLYQAEQRLNALKPGDFLIQDGLDAERAKTLGEEYVREQYRAALRSEAAWVNGPNGEYVLIWKRTAAPVVTTDGPVRFTWNTGMKGEAQRAYEREFRRNPLPVPEGAAGIGRTPGMMRAPQ